MDLEKLIKDQNKKRNKKIQKEIEKYDSYLTRNQFIRELNKCGMESGKIKFKINGKEEEFYNIETIDWTGLTDGGYIIIGLKK